MKRLLAHLCLLLLVSLGAAEGRLIVRMAPGASAQAVAQRYALRVADNAPKSPFVLMVTPFGANLQVIQDALNADPEVRWAEDDADLVMPEHVSGKGSTIGAISDRQALVSQNAAILTLIQWSAAEAAVPGRAVRLAILDTGLSVRQPALRSRVVAALNVVEPGSYPDDVPRGTDSNGNGVADEGAGHGTMIAGLVDLIAPQVGLVVVRVADSDGNTTSWRLIRGLAFASAAGAEVVNISLGSLDAVPALRNVMDWVEAKRILVVSPIGNNGREDALHPSMINKTVCVTGVNRYDKKALFSNWLNTADASAPAVGIQSTWWDGSRALWNGTSFASPLVAATVADGLRRTTPQLPGDLRDLIRSTGDDIDPLNPAYAKKLGHRLNVARTIQHLSLLAATTE